MATAALAQPKAPNIGRVQNFDLQGTLKYQEDSIRDRKFHMLGRMLNLRLGIDDNAEYFSGEAWERVRKTSKYYGLTLEWHQDQAPWVAFCEDRQTLVLPQGIQHMPTIAVIKNLELNEKKLDVRQNDAPRLPQRMADFSSGRIMGARGQGSFVVLQPIEQVAVYANVASGTLMLLKGSAIFGRHPFLMVDPFSPKAYIAGGALNF